MPLKIKRLSDAAINQIAAGEVIESPASVVKELVDNALDAGAGRITVEILGGGLQMVRIADDGCGMEKEDALLCLERHTTSKIGDACDLFSLETMGFRGEAIASIASISKMTLTTSLDEIGVRLEVDAGRVTSIDPHPRNRGTTIEVRHLFFNTPARRKFQKSPSACATEVTRILSTISLGYPHVAFELYNHGEAVFQLEPHSDMPNVDAMRARALAVLGDSFVSESILIDEREGSFHLEGILGLPGNTRHNRQGGYLFINGRPVTAPSLSFAIRDGFGTRIASDRHPVYVLSITMPASLVDVNVHPQKKEVRLSDEPMIKQLIQRAIAKALSAPLQQEASIAPAFVFSDFSFEEETKPIAAKTTPISSLPLTFSVRTQPSFQQDTLPFAMDAVEIIGLWKKYLLVDGTSFSDHGPMKMDGGICLVDLEGARARIAFERLLKSKDNPIASQGLMFPLSMQMSVAELDSLMQLSPILTSMGFSITQTTPRSILIDGLPPSYNEAKAKDALFEMATSSISLDIGDGEGLEGKKIRALAEIACRYGRERSVTVSLSEARAILSALFQTSSPYFCPEGKKTCMHLGEKDVERLFG